MKPWVTSSLLITIGQRYDIVFTANQAAGTYWFRASSIAACASLQNKPDALSIFAYKDAPDPNALPVSTPGTLPTDCNEPANANLVPWVKNTVDKTAFMNQVKNLTIDLTRTVSTNGENIVMWSVNLTAIDINWDKPTLQYVANKDTNYPATYNLIELPTANIVRIPPPTSPLPSPLNYP